MFNPREKTDFRYPVSVPFQKGSNRAHKPRTTQDKNSRATNKFPPAPTAGQADDPRRRKPRFLGSESGIEEHIYTLGNNQSEKFISTTNAISNHVGKTYKNGGDVKKSVDQLRIITIPPPADLPEATQEVPADPGDSAVNPPISPTPLIPATQGPTKTEERIWQNRLTNT